jgi:hypothetical protein
MNTWSSLWPTGAVGLPHDADPAAILLDAVPPLLLLILLTETVAAYRTRMAPLLSAPVGPDRPDPTEHPTRPPPEHPEPTDVATTDSSTTVLPLPRTEEQLHTAAREIDATHRRLTGRRAPVSLLRAELHISQSRARAVRDALLAADSPDPPTS